MARIKFLVMDVDGTLTDGKIYMGTNGELFKAFDIKDGCGIKLILPKYDIVPIIITARESVMLRRRCEELGIISLHQGVQNKLEKLLSIIEDYNHRFETTYTLKDCAYVGDDIIDIPCMKPIKDAGGIVGCPKDAVKQVRELADYVAEHNGGDGAVRDFIEWLIM